MPERVDVERLYFVRSESILRRLPAGRVALVAEVGVWAGNLAAMLLARRLDLVYVGVDRWATVPPDHRYMREGGPCAPGNDETHASAYRQAVELTNPFRQRCLLIRGETADVAKQLGGNKFDAVFIDADHSYDGVVEDLDAWLPLVRKGGWISGHDYGQPFGVKKAVDERFGAENVKLEADDCWFVKT